MYEEEEDSTEQSEDLDSLIGQLSEQLGENADIVEPLEALVDIVEPLEDILPVLAPVEMAEDLPCLSAVKCVFVARIGTVDQKMKQMEMHLRVAHGDTGNAGGGETAAHSLRLKLASVSPPMMDPIMDESKFCVWTQIWGVFKRSTGLYADGVSNDTKTLCLKRCLDPDIRSKLYTRLPDPKVRSLKRRY